MGRFLSNLLASTALSLSTSLDMLIKTESERRIIINKRKEKTNEWKIR